MNVNLSWHLCRLLHVDIVVEEVLEGWHLTERLQLVTVAFRLKRGSLLHLRLRANSDDTLNSLLLLLGVERSLALVIPELPGCLATMAVLRQELHRSATWCRR